MIDDRIDPLELLVELGINHPTRVHPVSDGWGDTRLWKVEHGGRTSLLRVYQPQLRNVRDRELAVMQAIDAVPVPSIEAIGEPHGLPALLLSWCAGTTLLEALMVAPGDAWDLGVEFGRTQARFHAIPVSATLREQVASSSSASGWIGWGADTGTPLDRLMRGTPLLHESILHLDYHPMNVLCDGDSITCVIDWANVRIGDVRADFART